MITVRVYSVRRAGRVIVFGLPIYAEGCANASWADESSNPTGPGKAGPHGPYFQVCLLVY